MPLQHKLCSMPGPASTFCKRPGRSDALKGGVSRGGGRASTETVTGERPHLVGSNHKGRNDSNRLNLKWQMYTPALNW